MESIRISPQPPDDLVELTRDLISATEAAELIGYSRQGIHNAIRQGYLDGIEIAGRPFLFRPQVLEYARFMKRLGPQKHTLRH